MLNGFHPNGHVQRLPTDLDMQGRKIAVIGSGYVGLVVAACFAEMGHSVICVDKDSQRVDDLRQGKVPIHEELLPELIDRHRGYRLSFSSSMRQAVRESDAIFIAVGTPSLENGETDLSGVEQVTRGIAEFIDGYKVIVEKSTVPVMTSDLIARIMLECGVDSTMFDVASNPEFLREGTAVVDFLHADRIVIGTHSNRAFEMLECIYRPLICGSYFSMAGCIPGARSAASPVPMLRTSTQSAELIKHASNAFLAMKISFINSVANICESVHADIVEVATGIGLDQRIGPKFLSAGLGYGGSCFPKDVKAFHAVASRTGTNFDLLKEVERINQAQQFNFLEKVRGVLGSLQGKKLGVLGLAFKAGTDDVRESPAIAFVRLLLGEGCSVAAFDPAAIKNAQSVLPATGVTFEPDPYFVADDADALLVLTEWPEFAQLDFEEIKQRLRQPIVLDGRNLLDGKKLRSLGYTYEGVGRSAVTVSTNRENSASGKRTLTVARKRTRVVVTGAAGFLGSHLVDALLAEGHAVLGVDNFLTGRHKNLEHLRNDPNFDLLEHDITEPFDPGAMDMLFNMASPASPIDYTVHGVETLLVGSAGTRNALDAARRYRARFLHCSTSECYGDPLVHPQPESYWGHVNPIGPRSVYDEAKRFSEALIMAYHRYYNVDTRIVRIFNTYGPRLQLNDGRVISNFLKQALCGEDLTVYGDGKQTRSFCYVSDQVEGLLRLMASSECEPVNIGNPEEFTILECAREVLAATRSHSKIVFRPLPQDDPKQRCPDITRARMILGWEPKVRLSQGLQLSIPWFQQNLQSETVGSKRRFSAFEHEVAERISQPTAS
jgi:UDPglucose 6-dehydrogenase